MAELKAPFPWFGGKRTIAGLIWQRLGNVDNYIEPFAGSCATLLLRPHPPKVETLNDLDCYVANFWRATQHAPDAVATYADGPVNEVDLHSRHRWLVLSEDAVRFRERMRTEPDYFDAKVAGWWCWGLCCWIGSGWCESGGSGQAKRPRSHRAAGSSDSPCDLPGVLAEGLALKQGRPQLGDAYDIGRGVNASPPGKRPYIAGTGGGNGVHSEKFEVGTCAQRREWLLDWFGRLRDRLRNVRVCCGDWSRVCSSESTTTRLGLTGVLLDPPYSAESKRAKKLYSTDSLTVAHEVRAWCLERGADRQMRIALCGYEGEGHEALESAGWKVEAWEAQGGYGNRSEAGKKNAKRERIWFSPHCSFERGLFDGEGEVSG